MKNIILFILILSVVQLSAQENRSKVRIGIYGGKGTYNQGDLKTINQNTIDQLPFNAKIVDEFEPSLNFGAYTQYELFNRFLIGPDYHYYYTGSSLGQKDYSGVFSFDQYLYTHALGLKMDYVLAEFNRLSFNAQLNTGVSFTKWKMDSKLNIVQGSEFQTDKFKGLSWYVIPAIVVDFDLFSHLSIFGTTGYSVDLIKNYKYEANKDFKIIKTPDWSGLKLSLGLQYSLN